MEPHAREGLGMPPGDAQREVTTPAAHGSGTLSSVLGWYFGPP